MEAIEKLSKVFIDGIVLTAPQCGPRDRVRYRRQDALVDGVIVGNSMGTRHTVRHFQIAATAGFLKRPSPAMAAQVEGVPFALL